MGSQTERNDYYWKVETTRGTIAVGVFSQLKQPEAFRKVLELLAGVGLLDVIGMEPKKRCPTVTQGYTFDIVELSPEQMEDGNTKEPWSVYGGKGLYAMLGRAAEYDIRAEDLKKEAERVFGIGRTSEKVRGGKS